MKSGGTSSFIRAFNLLRSTCHFVIVNLVDTDFKSMSILTLLWLEKISPKGNI